MKIAFVHDDLLQYGGAERLLLSMHALFPDAPVYTTVMNERILPDAWRNVPIRSSFLQSIPFMRKFPRPFAPFFPIAIESFDFSSFDVVISTSTRFAHGIITGPRTRHICYLNTPSRIWWDPDRHFGKRRRFMHLFWPFFRQWDLVSAFRPDIWIANSAAVKRRIASLYRAHARIIYPGVDLRRFTKRSSSLPRRVPFYLSVARLLPYKRIDLAIDACDALGRRLVIIGDGPERRRLEAHKRGAVVLGRLTDEEVVEYYHACTAVIIPGEEDFGMVAVEALASGKPVIAYHRGGVLEIVKDGYSGVFFPDATVPSLVSAIRRFEGIRFSQRTLRKESERFSLKAFHRHLRKVLESA